MHGHCLAEPLLTDTLVMLSHLHALDQLLSLLQARIARALDFEEDVVVKLQILSRILYGFGIVVQDHMRYLENIHDHHLVCMRDLVVVAVEVQIVSTC